MTTALERRFLAFLSSVPGSESLDGLLAGAEFDGQRRADFLLLDRKIVLEVKSLEVDVSPKIESEMERHRHRDDFPIFYGEVELEKVLQHLSDGDEIKRRIYTLITRSVESATRSAKEQIENTANLLCLTDSVGVMVLLNEGVKILSPDVVAAKVGAILQRKSVGGGRRIPIAYAWLICDNHIATSGRAAGTSPMVFLEGPFASKFDWLWDYLTYLQVAWSEFNGRPIVNTGTANPSDLDVEYVSATQNADSGEKISRQQLWERRYKSQPYLRELTDEEVLRRGKTIAELLAPHFTSELNDKKLGDIKQMLICWSDFLCEARYRGLDLRRLRDA